MGNMMVKVSVIVPVYNAGMFLRECIGSLVSQTLSDIEIICIDDCSTDQSLSILQEYQSKDGRIRIIRNEVNLGAAASRNKGLDEAAGIYVQFVDADDYLDTDTLENLFRTAEGRKSELCFLAIELTGSDAGKAMVPGGIQGGYPEVYDGKTVMKLFTEKDEFFLYLCMVFYQNQFLQENKLRFRRMLIGEGGDFILRALCMARRVIVSREKYYYRINEASVMHRDNAKDELLFGQIVQYIDVLRHFMVQENADELGFFLTKLYKKIAGGIQGLSEELRKKFEKRLETPFERHVFGMLQQTNQVYGIELDDKILSEIQKKEYVILYGAGYAAKEVIDLLHRYGIGIVGFAVTERRSGQAAVYGHHVYEIRELLSYRKKAVVLVTANRKYNREIRDVLEAYGFEDFIFLNIKI